LVLKRFFATPINRTFIVLGEGLSRVLFSMITAVVIIVFGKLFFGFTLVHGFETFLEMLVLSFLGLLVFMGFGLDNDNLHSPNEKFNLENYYKGIETIPYFHKFFAQS